MSGAFKAMWRGDEDPASQIVRMGDLVFVKGQSVTVPKGHAMYDAIHDNPTFAVDNAKAELAEVDEPTDDEQRDRAEEGTEKAAIKAELRTLGITVQGNPSIDTLRAKLVDATK